MDLTYEELKPTKPAEAVRLATYGLDLTYEELKPKLADPSTLPTGGLDLTYEELKLPKKYF